MDSTLAGSTIDHVCVIHIDHVCVIHIDHVCVIHIDHVCVIHIDHVCVIHIDHVCVIHIDHVCVILDCILCTKNLFYHHLQKRTFTIKLQNKSLYFDIEMHILP